MRNRIGAKDASANHESGRIAPLPCLCPAVSSNKLYMYQQNRAFQASKNISISLPCTFMTISMKNKRNSIQYKNKMYSGLRGHMGITDFFTCL